MPHSQEGLNLSDARLIEGARQGDVSQFGEFVRRHQDRLAAILINLLGSQEDAEDVAQEAFIRFYSSLSRFRGEAQPGTYLVRIAINLANDALRRRQRQHFPLLPFKESPETSSLKVEGMAVVDKRERQRAVQKALMALKPEQRSVAVLRLILEYSTDETARTLGIRPGTVMSRLSRASAQLRKLLVSQV